MRVRLLSPTLQPVSGVAQGSINAVSLAYPSGSISNLTPTTHFTWSEVTTSPFNGLGIYKLTLASSLFSYSSRGEYTVAATSGTNSAIGSFCFGFVREDLVDYYDVWSKFYLNKVILTNAGQYNIYDDAGTTIKYRFTTRNISNVVTSLLIMRRDQIQYL